MMRLFLAAALAAASLQVSAQAVPAANFTDMWWAGPSESGWGISFVQHSPSNKAYAVLYHYDPRQPDNTTPNGSDFVPIWFVMDGGTWVTPTQITGNVYVTNGTPFFNSGSNTTVNSAGTFTFNFTDFSNATFTYNIAPQGGLSPGAPAFGLPAFNGVKNITRQSF
jgi:hypothetical protein